MTNHPKSPSKQAGEVQSSVSEDEREAKAVRDAIDLWYEASPTFEAYSLVEEEFQDLTDRVVAALAAARTAKEDEKE